MIAGKIKNIDPGISNSGLDSRGAVYTYVPEKDIKEFNYIFTRAGSNRGHHCHNEFDEYIMLVDGEMIVQEILEDNTTKNIVLGIGQVICIPQSVKHVFIPITDCKFINFLTKPWHLCSNPITKTKS